MIVTGTLLFRMLRETVTSIGLQDSEGKMVRRISADEALGLCTHRDYIGYTRAHRVRVIREVSRYKKRVS